MKKLTSLDKAKLIARLAADKKGEDIVLLDMTNQSAMCDWFVIVSASSSRRIGAISEEIQYKLSRDRVFPLHVEGRSSPYWVLMDYVDVVVHIFHSEMRGFYGLERLWSEAPKTNV